LKAVVLVVVVAAAAGCTASRAFSRGERAARAGDWDLAVSYYSKALQASPNSAEYRIALERAQVSASRVHLERAAEAEKAGDLETAIREYTKAAEFDPANRQAAARASELDKTLRDRIEAARPRPAIEQMKQRARQATAEPILNPASRDPLEVKFVNTNVKDILNFIATASGINILYDRDVQDRQFTVDLHGISLEAALNQILNANQMFYKVLNERTIMVIPDNATKRQAYEEQVIRTFYISNAEIAEIQTLLNGIIALPGMANRPSIQVHKSANSITIRGSAALVAIAEKVIEANDKPRAEVVVDIEILEVNRTRVKQYGLNLSNYSISGMFSPERAPSTGTGGGSTTPMFNANTISKGINTSDFYLSVPSAVVRFLESDAQSKLIAKPSLRGAEGKKLTANLGDEIPVPSTTYTPLMTGGTAINPMTSYNYRNVGLNLEVTPRVTYDGDIILELMVESSTRGGDVNVAGQNLPSFGTRKVTTTMRLRDGESNLLAGLLRDEDRKALNGFPGAIHVPILKDLFSNNDSTISQTDIVMLLTPRIIRSHGLTDADLAPIYIGTATNPSLGGPPPLIAPGSPAADAPAIQPAAPTQPYGAPGAALTPGVPLGAPTPQGVPVLPPGSSPIPGTVLQPLPKPADPAAAAPAPSQPPTQPALAPVPALAPPAAPPAAAAPNVPPAARGATTTPLPAATISLTAGTEFRVGPTPYTVPISVSNINRVTTVSLSITYNPAALRVRTVSEGSFMRQGNVQVAFAQQVDPAAGRVDLTLTRTSDTVGASGSGILAALVFEAVAPGSATLSPSGVASGPGGSVPVAFQPVTITVR
jgi:type II secretory pathway component GspD/PulD (secretin)